METETQASIAGIIETQPGTSASFAASAAIPSKSTPTSSAPQKVQSAPGTSTAFAEAVPVTATGTHTDNNPVANGTNRRFQCRTRDPPPQQRRAVVSQTSALLEMFNDNQKEMIEIKKRKIVVAEKNAESFHLFCQSFSTWVQHVSTKYLFFFILMLFISSIPTVDSSMTTL